MVHSQRDNDFAKFAKRHNITLESVPIESRSQALGFGDNPEWNQTAIHNAVTLKIGDRLLWQGEYSRGIGHAETWARDPKRMEWRATRERESGDLVYGWKRYGGFSISMATGWEPLPFGKRYRPDAKPLQKLRALYAKKCPPDVADILESLQLDISGADQDFADWAFEYGYSDDSIRAKAIWESVNDTRRAFQRAMSPAQLAEFDALQRANII